VRHLATTSLLDGSPRELLASPINFTVDADERLEHLAEARWFGHRRPRADRHIWRIRPLLAPPQV
jgi:hypothetical protein